jgi:hypothetical protein
VRGFSLTVGGKGGLPVKYGVGRLLGLAMLSGLFVTGQQQFAFAQAGSTGGVIGKQDKSVSGGSAVEEPTVPANKPSRSTGSKRAAERPSGQDEAAHIACGRLAGVWTANGWYNVIYGRGDVVLGADGSARHISGIVGTWICRGGHFVMDWKNWAHGEGTLSKDGNTVTFADGSTMTRGK